MTTHTYVSLYTANVHSAKREMSASACTCSTAGCYIWLIIMQLGQSQLGQSQIGLTNRSTLVPVETLNVELFTYNTTFIACICILCIALHFANYTIKPYTTSDRWYDHGYMRHVLHVDVVCFDLVNQSLVRHFSLTGWCLVGFMTSQSLVLDTERD